MMKKEKRTEKTFKNGGETKKRVNLHFYDRKNIIFILLYKKNAYLCR